MNFSSSEFCFCFVAFILKFDKTDEISFLPDHELPEADTNCTSEHLDQTYCSVC